MQKQPFLKQILKNIKGKEQKLTDVETAIFEANIRKYGNWKEDNIMQAKISQIDLAAIEVKYHGWCRAKYQAEVESIFQSKNRKTPNDASSTHSEIYYQWHIEREVHHESFNALRNFIEV